MLKEIKMNVIIYKGKYKGAKDEVKKWRNERFKRV